MSPRPDREAPAGTVLEEFQGRGTVYLAFEHGRYEGYWDLQPDGPAKFLEQFPPSPDLSVALRWARERTSAVLVRPKWDPARYYWAGEGDPPNFHAPLERLDESTIDEQDE